MEPKPDAIALKAGIWMSRFERASGGEADAREAALLRQATAGDAAAFDEIITRHERRVLSIAWRLLGNLPDAEDAAQETFLRMFKYRHRIDPQKPIEGWLVGIAVNVCRDIGARRQRLERVPQSADTSPRAADPHLELELGERRALLRRALAALPETERTAIVLRDIEGFSTPQVAQTLGFTESTVRAQISRALVKLRKRIRRMKGARP